MTNRRRLTTFIAMSQAAQGTPRNSLDVIVERILASYRELGGINHIEGPNLPSRESVERIVEVLESLIFPGFVDACLMLDGMRYAIGERVVAVSRALTVDPQQVAAIVKKSTTRAPRAEKKLLRELLTYLQQVTNAVRERVIQTGYTLSHWATGRRKDRASRSSIPSKKSGDITIRRDPTGPPSPLPTSPSATMQAAVNTLH